MQEIMGLTFFMLDESKKDAEYCMETAFTSYIVLPSILLPCFSCCTKTSVVCFLSFIYHKLCQVSPSSVILSVETLLYA